MRLSFGFGPVRFSAPLTRRRRRKPSARRVAAAKGPIQVRGYVVGHGPGTVTVRAVSGDLYVPVAGPPTLVTVTVPRPYTWPDGMLVDLALRRHDRKLLHLAAAGVLPYQ